MQTAVTTTPFSVGAGFDERDLPIEIVLGAAKYAELVRGTDRMIPADRVMDVIAEKRGWK